MSCAVCKALLSLYHTVCKTLDQSHENKFLYICCLVVRDNTFGETAQTALPI